MLQTGRERLADYRRRSKLKQYELADLLGLHETTLSQILAGKRRPGLDIALRIETLTGVPVESWSAIVVGEVEKRRERRAKRAHVGKAKRQVALG
jgi:transcriptional regulator with XRE-family HTH domain